MSAASHEHGVIHGCLIQIPDRRQPVLSQPALAPCVGTLDPPPLFGDGCLPADHGYEIAHGPCLVHGDKGSAARGFHEMVVGIVEGRQKDEPGVVDDVRVRAQKIIQTVRPLGERNDGISPDCN